MNQTKQHSPQKEKENLSSESKLDKFESDLKKVSAKEERKMLSAISLYIKELQKAIEEEKFRGCQLDSILNYIKEKN